MKKIICFHDTDSGRDVQALTPIIYFLEKILNYTVEQYYIYDTYKIITRVPDLVLTANIVGSKKFVSLSRECYERGIPFFALTAEGNLPEQFFINGDHWGWNKEQILYQNKLCIWSKKVMGFYEAHCPDINKDRLALTGAPGFDLYKMLQYQRNSTEVFPNQKSYRLIIGYAGWAFGKAYSSSDLQHLKRVSSYNFDENIKWMKEKRKEVEFILRSAIESNPDILFVLKKHPREHSPAAKEEPLNEMIQLQNYDNVIYLKDNNVSLYKIISSCHLWTCFESTTALEAWLLDIPTVYISPKSDTSRTTDTITGSLVIKDEIEFENTIKKLRSAQLDEYFEDKVLIQNRINIIERSIGFADGLNHVRTALLIQEACNESRCKNKIVKLNLNELYDLLLYQLMRLLLKVPVLNKLHKIRKHQFFTKNFSKSNLMKNQQDMFNIISNFYLKLDIKKSITKIRQESYE